jgi:hypothetical protein
MTATTHEQLRSLTCKECERKQKNSIIEDSRSLGLFADSDGHDRYQTVYCRSAVDGH